MTILYPYIRAWGHLLGSSPQYVAREIDNAHANGAPQNAVYEQYTFEGPRAWTTFDQIKNKEIRSVIEDYVRTIQLNGEQA